MSSSADVTKLALAVAVATAAVASWAHFAYAFGGSNAAVSPRQRSSRRRRRTIIGNDDDDDDDCGGGGGGDARGHFDVPPEILEGDDCGCREEVALAVRLALEAGRNMIRHLDARGTAQYENSSYDLGVSTKSNSADLATAIDVLNEDYIVREISRIFPAHRIIGEESTGSGTVLPVDDPNGERTWIIDPIDGTTNFASGLPLCCVSVGMCVMGKPHMGVAYAPATDELYVAVRGRGAYRNGARLMLPSTATRDLSDSVVGFEFGYTKSGEGVDLVARGVTRLLRHGVRATRSLGSGVLDLCYVASGRLDVVYAGLADEGWRPWDYCAGLVVANEAGCTMTHLLPRCAEDVDPITGETRRGYEFNLLSRSVICGVSEELVEQTRRVVLGLQ